MNTGWDICFILSTIEIRKYYFQSKLQENQMFSYLDEVYDLCKYKDKDDFCCVSQYNQLLNIRTY